MKTGSLRVRSRCPPHLCGLAVAASRAIVAPMPMTLDQLVDETRDLPQDVRAELVERILLAAHGGIAPRVDDAWKRETRRRIADIQSGRARGIPLDDALAEARKSVGL